MMDMPNLLTEDEESCRHVKNMIWLVFVDDTVEDKVRHIQRHIPTWLNAHHLAILHEESDEPWDKNSFQLDITSIEH
jgi:hypothetical protein